MNFSIDRVHPSVWLSVFCISIFCAYSQTPTTSVTPASIQLNYLEYLVKAQIDSIRKTQELPSLVSDSILYLSARDHADYLSGEPVSSPYQKHPRKKTVQDRAHFQGARNYLAEENILTFTLEKLTSLPPVRLSIRGPARINFCGISPMAIFRLLG